MEKRALVVAFEEGDFQRYLENLSPEERSEVFLPYANQLVLAEHQAIASCHNMNFPARFLSLGILAPVNGSLLSPGIPTSRHVSSRDNVDVVFEDGNIPALLPEGTYSSMLFIGDWAVETWFAKQKRFPFLRDDLFSRLMYVDMGSEQVPLFV